MRALLLVLLGTLVLGSPPPESVQEFYADGTVKLRYDVDENGRRHGNFTELYRDGQVKVRARYRAGELDGAYATFHPDGSKHVYAKYKKGALHGKYTDRLPDGNLRLTAVYKDGALDGPREFYAGKKVSSRQKWKDGELLEIDGVVPFPRSLDEIRAGLDAIYAPEAELPLTAETEEETLRIGRERGLLRLMAYRFLVGISYEHLALDEQYNYFCQWGAKLCAAIDRLDHTPANPGWPDGEYRDGYRGTSSSNLASTGDIPISVDMYMDDSDPSNIDRIGHRMHCLNPALGKTGFGSFGGYSAMWSMDRSGKVKKTDAIAYPPRGYVPVGYFGERHAWSLNLSDGHRVGNASDVTAKVWQLDDLYARTDEPLPIDHIGKVGANTLVFRPVGLLVADGEKYWIEIEGLKGGKRDEPLRFLVEFVDL